MENSRVAVAQALYALWRVTPRNKLVQGGRVAKIAGMSPKDAHAHLKWFQRNGYIYCPEGKRGWYVTQDLLTLAKSREWQINAPPPKDLN